MVDWIRWSNKIGEQVWRMVLPGKANWHWFNPKYCYLYFTKICWSNFFAIRYLINACDEKWPEKLKQVQSKTRVWNSFSGQTLSVSLLCGLMRKLARKKSISSSMSSLRNGAPRENGLSALREKINRNFKPKEQRDLSDIHRYDTYKEDRLVQMNASFISSPMFRNSENRKLARKLFLRWKRVKDFWSRTRQPIHTLGRQ